MTTSLHARWNVTDQWLKIRPEINRITSEVSAPLRRSAGSHEDYFHRVTANTFLGPIVAPGHLKRSEAAAALPDPSALYREIEVFYPATQKRLHVTVRDIGPNHVRDPYWDEDRGPKPLHPDSFEREWRLGLSLTPAAWQKLGLSEEHALRLDFSDEVLWRFLEEPCYDCDPRLKNALYPPVSPFF